MKTKFAIGRHINGIFLNPLEYVLDSKGDVMQFESEFDCEQFLREHGASEDEIYYYVFEPITDGADTCEDQRNAVHSD